MPGNNVAIYGIMAYAAKDIAFVQRGVIVTVSSGSVCLRWHQYTLAHLCLCVVVVSMLAAECRTAIRSYRDHRAVLMVFGTADWSEHSQLRHIFGDVLWWRRRAEVLYVAESKYPLLDDDFITHVLTMDGLRELRLSGFTVRREAIEQLKRGSVCRMVFIDCKSLAGEEIPQICYRTSRRAHVWSESGKCSAAVTGF